jgi:hypothetical protein
LKTCNRPRRLNLCSDDFSEKLDEAIKNSAEIRQIRFSKYDKSMDIATYSKIVKILILKSKTLMLDLLLAFEDEMACLAWLRLRLASKLLHSWVSIAGLNDIYANVTMCTVGVVMKQSAKAIILKMLERGKSKRLIGKIKEESYHTYMHRHPRRNDKCSQTKTLYILL